MKTLGIDLAANPAKTAACLVDWTARSMTMLDRPVEDDAIVEAASTADLAAFDVPFGWPDEFVDALVSHRRGRGWPPIEQAPPADRERLRFRTTDLDLIEQGFRPLSVSSDRIGVAAMRGARILELLARAGLDVDRSGTSGSVAEVYPAAALRTWGLPSSGYKGSGNRANCAALSDRFAAACGTMAGEVTSCLAGADDDEFDAVLCAFIGLAVVQGNTRSPDQAQLPQAQREGWIHVPTRSPAEIADPGGTTSTPHPSGLRTPQPPQGERRR